MSIIKAYSQVAEEFVAADYPSLKLCLRFRDGTNPAVGFYDDVTKKVASLASGAVNSITSYTDGLVGLASSAQYTLPSEIIFTTGKYALVVMTAIAGAADTISALGLVHATVTTGAIRFIGGNMSFDPSNAVTPTIVAGDWTLAGYPELRANGYVIGAAAANQAEAHLVSNAAGTPAYTTATATPGASMGSPTLQRFQTSCDLSGTPGALLSLMAFEFTTKPSDLIPALLWMNGTHNIGDPRSPYPGWKGRS